MEKMLQGLLLTYIEAICSNIFFDTFLEARYKKKPWVSFSVISILAILLTAVSIMSDGSYYIEKAIIVIGVIASLMAILYKNNLLQTIFFAVCYYGILLAIDSGLMVVVPYLLQENMNDLVADTVKVTVLGILCKTILFLCVILIQRKFARADNYYFLEDNELILFLFFPIFTVVAMLLFLTDGGNGRRAVLVVSFGMVAANFILFYMLRNFVDRSKERQEMRLMHERTRNQVEMYGNMEASYNEQKSRVHEFVNHIGCIKGLLLDGNQEEALEYASKISSEVEGSMNQHNTANPVINTVVNQKYRQAKKEGTGIIMILSDLGGIHIQNEDLVILLANLLDNAIEACRKLNESERLIRFRFVQDGEKVVIATKNPVKGNLKIMDERIATTKEYKEGHGIGMTNIERVVWKYGGESMYSCHDGFFYYTVIFKK